MMRNDDSQKILSAFAFGILSLCIGLILAFAIGSCSSSRNTIRSRAASDTVSVSQSSHADTILLHDTITLTRRDTLRRAASEEGTLAITRDSLGRPAFIRWRRLAAGTAIASAGTRSVRDVASSASGSASRSAAAHAEAFAEETQVETVGRPWECIVGSSLMGLAIIYVIYVVIADHIIPWLRQRNR